MLKADDQSDPFELDPLSDPPEPDPESLWPPPDSVQLGREPDAADEDPSLEPWDRSCLASSSFARNWETAGGPSSDAALLWLLP